MFQHVSTGKIKQCYHGSNAEDLEEAAETLPTLLKVSVEPCEI
jgi:hypothetical protein